MTVSERTHLLRSVYFSPIPVATLCNWEQGRVLPDPAALSLLTVVAHNPKARFKALAA
jgi:DNA-binding transcriptional regulator YiaG